MLNVVATLAQRNPVTDFIPQIGERCPRLDVVRVQSLAYFTAPLAGELAHDQDGSVPFLVGVASGLRRTRRAIAAIPRVPCPTLELRRRAPFFRVRTFRDSAHEFVATIGILPLLADLLALPFGALRVSIGTGARTVSSASVGDPRRGDRERIAAHLAFALDGQCRLRLDTSHNRMGEV
jgi:hypothetical protein